MLKLEKKNTKINLNRNIKISKKYENTKQLPQQLIEINVSTKIAIIKTEMKIN